jgi:hypothetical protein
LVNENLAFYAIKRAIERSRPELVESIQGRQELERMTHEISAALKEAGLCLAPAREIAAARALHGTQQLS